MHVIGYPPQSDHKSFNEPSSRKVQSDAGIAPLKSLKFKYARSRKELGMRKSQYVVIYSWMYDLMTWYIDVPRSRSEPNTSGIVPLKLLPSRERYRKPSNSPMDAGIGPA